MRLKILLLYFVLFVYESAKAQEMAGLVHSNFAGTDVLYSNPAGLHHQKDWLSIHLLSADFFISNDYLYLAKEDFKFSNLLSGNLNIPQHPTGYSEGQRPFYIYDRAVNTRMDIDLKFQGPAAMYIRKQHAFAIFTGARSILHMRNISPELGRLGYYGFGYVPQHDEIFNIKDFNNTFITWGEVGLSYAYQWNRRLFSNWNFGISIKRLFGVGGTYLHVNNSDYNVINDSTLDLQSMDAHLGFSLPSNYDGNEFPTSPYINGKGWGFDLGVEYQELLDRQSKDESSTACGQRHWDYKYRVGISLMDFGWIKFDNNAQLHEYSNTDYTWNRIDTTKYENWNQLMQEVSFRFYGDPNASLQANKFTMWLPTSININGDYNFENGIYVNASLVYNLPFNGSFVRKPSVFSLTPRFEKQNVEVSLPLSLYQWKYPRVGLAVRFYYLTIGSDYFTSLMGWHDFNGMDLYISLKVNIRKGSCEKRTKINPCGDALNKFPWSK
jgi:hypothetical protein